jgi:hypothetical protein
MIAVFDQFGGDKQQLDPDIRTVLAMMPCIIPVFLELAVDTLRWSIIFM